MADIKSPQERSRNMSKIRSQGTKPEVWLQKQLFACGFRYRKYSGAIPGHPDLWLARYKTAVFVHGCYWHRHQGCKYAYTPKSHMEFWETKFRQNRERDSAVQKALEERKIRILIVWECTINRAMKSWQEKEHLLREIRSFLAGSAWFLEL